MRSPNHRRQARGNLLPFAVATALLIGTVPALATDYFVATQDPRAADTNPGTENLPWKSLYSISKANLQPGDTVYVKPGSYEVSGGDWSSPAINPKNSGTKDKPITIKALPRHGATVKATGSGPALGSYMRHYIVIDGFVVTSANPKGIGVFGSTYTNKVIGVVVQNNIVRDISNTHATDNTDGIRVENSSYAVVRNNLLYNIKNGTTTHNAAGVKLYRAAHTVIENNEIHHAGAGVFDKAAGESNIIRRNFIHDCNRHGVLVYNDVSIPTRDISVYENIVNNCSNGIVADQSTSANVVDNVKVYNNVVANYREAGMFPIKYNNGKFRAWNNIFYRTTPPGAADFYTYNDPPVTVALMDFNLFMNGATFQLGRYTTNRKFSSLTSWQAGTGFDAHSFTGDAGFVNASGGDFRLSPGCIAEGSGRVNGLSTGAKVNLGAYPNGTGTVGLIQEQQRPRAPYLLEVK